MPSDSHPKRIGMIVPSSNTCLEPQTYRILADRTDVTVHFTRVPVTRIGLDPTATTQFNHTVMTEAARLLATADVDVIAWNGTAGSWLGASHDRELVEAVTDATGIPATTSTLAYLEAFRASGTTRVGLVTPYTADVNEAIITRYAAEGVEVTGEHHLGLTDNESFARVKPAQLIGPSRELATGNGQTPQALAYVCTNLYGAPVVAHVEDVTGVAVLDSVAVTLWRCLAMIDAAPLEPRWGRLLTSS